jgi:hypothetical protein
LLHRARQRRIALHAALAAGVLLAALPAATLAHDPVDQRKFMHALGQIESGGRYDAVNRSSGAYGKYQIMPANWRAWARLYLGNPNARPTPRNQERVAHAKIRALWTWLRSWRVVAHWWLTGSSSRETSTWSEYSTRYVERVMTIYRESGGGRRKPPVRHRERGGGRRVIGDSSRSIAYLGGWRSARHGSYSGDTVRFAERPGASARLTFKGRSVTWVGPKGPTRGRARVYLDGRLAGTVNLRSSTFQARAGVFSKSWPRSGRHTLRIVVLGVPGPKMVAIDEFIVR